MVRLYSLTDYHILLKQAITDDYITENDLASLRSWREDPANWTGATTRKPTP